MSGISLRTALALFLAIWTTGSGGGQHVVAASARYVEPADVAAFRVSVGGAVTPVIVELKGDPTVVQKVAGEQAGKTFSIDQLAERSLGLVARQDAFLAALYLRDVRALLKVADVPQIDGSIRHVEWRFTYLLNGFVLYVADADIERLRVQPEVLSLEIPEGESFHLNRAIDYSLGTAINPADRRLAVYGANQELDPVGSAGHAETPRTTALDGFEGQDINIAIIDSGVDWRHPMFGGIGLQSPNPRVSGNAPAPGDNTKVIYYYALSSPGDPTDDFGHGTLVAACAAGFKVDGNTPARAGFGTGRDGTGIGPTLDGQRLHGTAPQARILGYKVCGPAPQCAGDIPLAIEDAASPFTLVSSGNGGQNPVAKPVADVINLSLGDSAGSATAASARAANNAALAGTMMVASAGNSGPGAGTVGSPSAATLAISVAASLDPGSVSSGDVLAPAQIPNELSAGKTPGEGAVAGPPEENGAPSDANAVQPNERVGMKMFPVAGAGPILGGSVSAHYVFVDLRPTGSSAPATVTNRIALVKFTGTFAAAANRIAPLNPAAILLITAVESATAAQVLNGIPTYTVGAVNGDYLIDLMRSGDPGDGNPAVDVPHGTVSSLPIRVAESASPAGYQPAMAGFSSRGPNDHPISNFRQIKPDVTGPGVGIVGAATPDGIPDDALGLASPSGYTQANGTSFSGPITAGAAALVRQYVRSLGFDTTNLAAADYRRKRYDSVTIARALLQNNATNLRDGFGAAQADGPAAASINDLGSGHINVAGALDGKAIMVAPTLLLKDADSAAAGDQREFNVPAREAPALDAQGNLEVQLPTYSFASVPVVGVEGILVKKARVIIRDITSGQGGGAYSLSFQNNRDADHRGLALSFLAADGATPATSVTVPTGGSAEFFVQAAVDGRKVLIDGFEFLWYVTATHSGGRTLRMPFYYRAVQPVLQGITAPVQAAPAVETPKADPACGIDTNGNYTLNFTYTKPTGGLTPAGFRVQEASVIVSKFFDNADETLAGGANSKWSGSAQWSSQVNPETGSMAYFIPDTANQNESLTLITPVVLSAGSATLTFDTYQDTEEDFDYALVELSIDNGASYVRLGTFSGLFAGSRQFDLSGFAGNSVKLRFRLTSDLAVPAPGWYVENIRITSDDFTTIAEPGAAAVSQLVSGRGRSTRYYRVAGLFGTPGGNVTGPYSNTKCITVDLPNARPVANAGADFAINEGQNAMLSGARSSDPDGGTLTYAWHQTAGPAVRLNGANTATPSFTAPAVTADTPLSFRLTVTDAEGAAHADDIVVTVHNVNVPPVANAGPDFAVNEGESALLNGAGSSDADGGVLNYAWEQTAGPAVALNGANTATASFTAPAVTADTPLAFRLTVRDQAGASSVDSAVVTVRNLADPAVTPPPPPPPAGNNRLGGGLPAGSLLVVSLLGLLRLASRRRF